MAVAAHPTLTISFDDDPVDHLRLIPSSDPVEPEAEEDTDATSAQKSSDPEPSISEPASLDAGSQTANSEQRHVWTARRDAPTTMLRSGAAASREPSRLRSADDALTPKPSADSARVQRDSLSVSSGRSLATPTDASSERALMSLARQVAGLQAQRDNALDRLDLAEREIADLRQRQIQSEQKLRKQLQALKHLAEQAPAPRTLDASAEELEQVEQIVALLRKRRSQSTTATARPTGKGPSPAQANSPAAAAETIPAGQALSTARQTSVPSAPDTRIVESSTATAPAAQQTTSTNDFSKPVSPWTPGGDGDETLTLQALLDPRNNPMPLMVETPFYDAEPMPRAIRRKATRHDGRRARRKARRQDF